jgi:HSP20 family molecular chaperone IbpA
MSRYDRSNILPRIFGQDYWDMFDYPSSLFDLDYGDSVFEPFNAIEDTLYHPRNYGYQQQQQRNRRPYQQSLQRSPYQQQQYGQQGSQLATQQPQQMQQRQQLGTQIQNDQNQFSVALDCRHFNPNEIEVTYGDNNSVQIHGKHEERSDEHGFISREFNRRYVLPRECELDKLNASWNENGQLQISCPKQPQQRQVGQGRKVPIQGIENYQPRQSQLQQGQQSQFGQHQQGQQYGQQFQSGQQSQYGQHHQGEQIPISTSSDQPKSSFELSSGQKDQTKQYGSQAQSDLNQTSQLGSSHRSQTDQHSTDIGGRSPSDMDIDQKSPQIGSQSDFPELNKKSQDKGKESVTSGLGSDIGKESSKHDAQKTTEKTSAIRG